MPLQEYLNLELLKLTSRHVSGALMLMIGFWLVDQAAKFMVPSGYVLQFLEYCEKTVIISGTAWLAFFVLWELAAMLVKLVKGQKLLAILVG